MMSEGATGNLDLNDEDRLPWLEPASEESYRDEVSVLRLIAFIAGGRAILGLVVGGVYIVRDWFSNDIDATLIAAPEGDYKIPAKDADAKKFDGEGDTSFASSEGIDRDGRIDPSRLTEDPIVPAAKPKAASGGDGAAKTNAAEKGDDASSTPEPKASGPMIQLGAYASDAIAREAWSRFSKRFDYLADLNHSIQPVTVNGSKFYRLRASVGSGQASTLCGKLKVAGENCIVVN